MKKIGKLKLNQLNKAEFEKAAMKELIGGGYPGCCQCGCPGPSSTYWNDYFNTAEGSSSGTSGNCTCDTCPYEGAYAGYHP